MYSFDSLTLKKFSDLNYDFLKNSSVQKVQQPSRREIILNIRNNGENKKLYVNINPKYAHICFINQESFSSRALEIPKSPPMFCMQLRKYIEGSRIKEIVVPEYERILELHFETWDEIGQLQNLCLAIEIMGKHSNVILYDYRSKNILGTAHNISPQKSSIREVYGGIAYIYPPKQDKSDILKTSYGAFCEVISDSEDIKKEISKHYYHLSEAIVEKVLSQNYSQEELFSKLQNIAGLKDEKFLCDFWGADEFNAALDKYFSNLMFNDIFSTRMSMLEKITKDELKKLSKLAKNPPDDKKALLHKQKGDLIFQYIYLIKNGDKTLKTPEGEIVELDETLSPSDNAQNYYRLYSKAKGAYEYKKKGFDEAIGRIEYLKGVLFSIQNAKEYFELDEIEQELFEAGLIKNKNENKKLPPAKLEKFEVEGYEIYLGRNNKQNDYLISKLSAPNDLWFHTYNCPSSHVLIKIKNGQKQPSGNVLEYAANLVKNNSPAKDSGKTSIIYTKRKDLKKPPGGVLGYVIYKNEKEIVV